LKTNVQGCDGSPNLKLATKYLSSTYGWLTKNILQIPKPCTLRFGNCNWRQPLGFFFDCL